MIEYHFFFAKSIYSLLFLNIKLPIPKSAISLYEQMNYGRLRNKIHLIDLPNEDDISSTFKKTGYSNFYKYLKQRVISF